MSNNEGGDSLERPSGQLPQPHGYSADEPALPASETNEAEDRSHNQTDAQQAGTKRPAGEEGDNPNIKRTKTQKPDAGQSQAVVTNAPDLPGTNSQGVAQAAHDTTRDMGPPPVPSEQRNSVTGEGIPDGVTNNPEQAPSIVATPAKSIRAPSDANRSRQSRRPRRRHNHPVLELTDVYPGAIIRAPTYDECLGTDPPQRPTGNNLRAADPPEHVFYDYYYPWILRKMRFLIVIAVFSDSYICLPVISKTGRGFDAVPLDRRRQFMHIKDPGGCHIDITTECAFHLTRCRMNSLMREKMSLRWKGWCATLPSSMSRACSS